MKVLNLVYPEKSDIKYRIDKFPDKQNNITIGELPKCKGTDEDPIMIPYEVQIKSRLNNFQDLELITCAIASLRNLGVRDIHLYVPYFLGSRSDRKFEEGGNNYLKDVICPIINSLNFKTVTCIDPHSYSLECCIKNFRSIDNSQLVKFALNQIYNENK